MAPTRQQQAALEFKALHAVPEGFILPNAWDAGSALVLAAEGFEAVATTSAGIAFSLGKQDYWVTDPGLAVSKEDMFERMAQIAAAAQVPVNGDLEAGYGDAPDAVADCVRRAIAAGLAGGNIEDKPPLRDQLYDEALAVERIAAARSAIDALGNAFVLNARTDILQTEGPDALAACIRRANRLREAGADCIFTPGVTDPESVRTLVREIQAPLNLVAGLGNSTVGPRALLEAGVRRVSLGGSIARAALGFVRQCARELRREGTINFARQQIQGAELNAIFARVRARDTVGAHVGEAAR